MQKLSLLRPAYFFVVTEVAENVCSNLILFQPTGREPAIFFYIDSPSVV
jgi:hypothetical protein